MEIQIDPHTRERAEERGATEDEIRDAILTGFSILGKRGRLRCAHASRTGKGKIYEFNQTRNGKYYEEKRVEVFYVIEDNVIITVTVYVFYGKW